MLVRNKISLYGANCTNAYEMLVPNKIRSYKPNLLTF